MLGAQDMSRVAGELTSFNLEERRLQEFPAVVTAYLVSCYYKRWSQALLVGTLWKEKRHGNMLQQGSCV